MDAHNDVRRTHGISTLAPAPTRARHKSRNSGHQPRDIARPTRALMHIHVRPGAVGRHMQKESTRTDQTRARNAYCPTLTGQGIASKGHRLEDTQTPISHMPAADIPRAWLTRDMACCGVIPNLSRSKREEAEGQSAKAAITCITSSALTCDHLRRFRFTPAARWPVGFSTVRWTDATPFLKQVGQAQGKQAEAASASESLASPRHASELW